MIYTSFILLHTKAHSFGVEYKQKLGKNPDTGGIYT